MKLIIGGYAQGKLKYVKEKYPGENLLICDASLPEKEPEGGRKIVIYQFHEWVKEEMLHGKNPEEDIAAFLEKHEDSILISDEIGNGIVPVDAFLREYRERTGRILIRLAKQADEVVRVICGIGQKIK